MDKRDHLLNHLFGLTNRGIKLGLDPMREAAARHGNPQCAYPSILVGGTNGKGSTCAFLESVLRHAGFTTGLYTSPHLVAFEERFAINGRPVSTDQWLSVYRDVGPTVDALGLTFFEAATLIAFELFKREGVDWAIMEVGLGGRLDATNILVPRACVITSVDLDHRQYLGNDLVSIAREKLGIAKKGVPLIMRTRGIAAIEAQAVTTCDTVGAALRFVDGSNASLIGTDAGGVTFAYGNEVLRTSLGGGYQIGNALLAIEALHAIGVTEFPKIREGIASAWLPGRFQTVRYRERTLIFDVAHNPAAVAHLVSTLETIFSGGKITFVVGVMEDKDHGAMIPEYFRLARSIAFTRPDIARAADPGKLSANAAGFAGEYRVIPRVEDAVRWALSRPEADPICITGSFYTVGEAMTALGIEPFAQQESMSG